MNAIELLTQQHDEVEDLFAQIEEAEEDEEKETILQSIADNLAAHATIEEKLFYPAAYRDTKNEEHKELLREAVEEHLAMKRLIADLIEMTPKDENFDAKVKVLKEQVEHHVEEEEGELFKTVKSELPETQLEWLGDEMEKMFERELRGEPAEKIPRQTRKAAPL